MSERENESPKAGQVRGRVVEGVRSIFIGRFGTGGFLLGGTVASESTGKALLFIFLGAACGYVVGGVAGRLTLRAVKGMEKELHRKPAPQLAGGVVGLVISLVIAALLMIPLLFVPGAAAWPAIIFLYIVCASLGFRLGEGKHEDIFGLLGMKPRASVAVRGDVHVIDTRALIDGGWVGLVRGGAWRGAWARRGGYRPGRRWPGAPFVARERPRADPSIGVCGRVRPISPFR